MLDDLNN